MECCIFFFYYAQKNNLMKSLLEKRPWRFHISENRFCLRFRTERRRKCLDPPSHTLWWLANLTSLPLPNKYKWYTSHPPSDTTQHSLTLIDEHCQTRSKRTRNADQFLCVKPLTNVSAGILACLIDPRLGQCFDKTSQTIHLIAHGKCKKM